MKKETLLIPFVTTTIIFGFIARSVGEPWSIWQTQIIIGIVMLLWKE